MAPVTISFSDHTIVPPVYVAGSFSGWKTVGLDASWYQNELGEDRFAYQKTLDLEPGLYQYKFRLGAGNWWVCDNQSLQTRDEHGNENNLLVIEGKSLKRQDNKTYKEDDTFAKLLDRNTAGPVCSNCSKDNVSSGTKPNHGSHSRKGADHKKDGMRNQSDSDRIKTSQKHTRPHIDEPTPLQERARTLGPGASRRSHLISPEFSKSDLEHRRRSMPVTKEALPESSGTRRSSHPVTHASSGSNATKPSSQSTNRGTTGSPLKHLSNRTQTLPVKQATPDSTVSRRSSALSNDSAVRRVHSQPVDRVTVTEASIRRASTQPLRQSVPWSSGRAHRCPHDRPSLQLSSTFDDTVDWTPVLSDKKPERKTKTKKKGSIAARALDTTKSVLLLTAAAFTGPIIFALYWKKDEAD